MLDVVSYDGNCQSSLIAVFNTPESCLLCAKEIQEEFLIQKNRYTLQWFCVFVKEAVGFSINRYNSILHSIGLFYPLQDFHQINLIFPSNELPLGRATKVVHLITVGYGRQTGNSSTAVVFVRRFGFSPAVSIV